MTTMVEAALAGGEWGKRLFTLDMSKCGLTDTFIERVLTVRAFAGMPLLSRLCLDENEAVSEKGYAWLVKRLAVVKRAGLCVYLQEVSVGGGRGGASGVGRD